MSNFCYFSINFYKSFFYIFFSFSSTTNSSLT
nr:MAG TPA: hypothetical protein [Bacteriophage sp.]